ncbi:hypothetical protein CPB83DRAFT_758503 [Crepidotus variabilis]|uniref:DUF4211 domain-containing protein n=1 Tax=Crepidotus variabilis TaxID=179855 RepID=A0A9P6JTD9_9AGAR|nr:hypothetical protein CPB83DRAFT_758503 [Crepidotus variabilis]
MSSPIKLTKTRTFSPDSSSDDLGEIHLAPATHASTHDDGDEDDNLIVTKSSRKRRLVSRSPSLSVREEDTKSKIVLTSELEAQSEEVEPAPTKRRRLRRRGSSQDRNDSTDDDAKELVEEVDEERILETRLRTRGKKSTFQENLEKLRSLQNDVVELDSESEGEEDEASFKPFKGAKPSRLNDADEDDDDSSSGSSGFIVEDDDVVQLPAQFSMETHQDISHQFKKIFQFFVYVAVQPLKRRRAFMQNNIENEEYFSVPLQVTQRKLSGMRDSLVASSIWKPEYKKNLEKFPEFSLTVMDFAVPHCDACNLGSRMSTLVGRLEGEPYDPLGFNNIPNKKKRRSDKDEKSEYSLGRFCARRTRVYHKFSHWEFNLFSTIEGELENVRSSRSSGGFQRVAFFRGREPPEDLTDADAFCEWLDERKVIDMEWQKLKEMMESARHLEIHGKGGDDED